MDKSNPKGVQWILQQIRVLKTRKTPPYLIETTVAMEGVLLISLIWMLVEVYRVQWKWNSQDKTRDDKKKQNAEVVQTQVHRSAQELCKLNACFIPWYALITSLPTWRHACRNMQKEWQQWHKMQLIPFQFRTHCSTVPAELCKVSRQELAVKCRNVYHLCWWIHV